MIVPVNEWTPKGVPLQITSSTASGALSVNFLKAGIFVGVASGIIGGFMPFCLVYSGISRKIHLAIA